MPVYEVAVMTEISSHEAQSNFFIPLYFRVMLLVIVSFY